VAKAVRDAAVDVDVAVVTPDELPKVFARDQVAGPLEQQSQHHGRLSLDSHRLSVLRQFQGLRIELECVEAVSPAPHDHLTCASPSDDWRGSHGWRIFAT
jgi:hypothetical protein